MIFPLGSTRTTRFGVVSSVYRLAAPTGGVRDTLVQRPVIGQVSWLSKRVMTLLVI